MRYVKAGTYVAVCNRTNFDGHYAVVFELPSEGSEFDRPVGTDAGWYFLNRVNGVACLEGVYPLEIFDVIGKVPF